MNKKVRTRLALETHKRRMVDRTALCNEDRLFGPIKGAIEYLQEVAAEHPEYCLGSSTSGWWDIEEVVFEYESLETDDELIMRLEHEREKQERAARELAVKEQREKDLAQYRTLKLKLGLW